MRDYISYLFQIATLCWIYFTITLNLRKAKLNAENEDLKIYRDVNYDRYVILYGWIARVLSA